MRIFFCIMIFLCTISVAAENIISSIPDSLLPRIREHEPTIKLETDSIIKFQQDSVRYEVGILPDGDYLLIITIPMPELDSRAYRYSHEWILKERLSLEADEQCPDGFCFIEATIESLSPIRFLKKITQPYVTKE